MRVHATPLAGHVLRALRRMILVGELRPGDRPTQDQLATMLGVSTMPVREALLRLVAEGLVVAEPNRSFSICRIRAEDVRDGFWLHSRLAEELARRACAQADRVLVDELVMHQDGYRTAAATGDLAAMERANWAFHRSINRAARAPRLEMALKTTLRFIPEGFHSVVDAWPSDSVAAHDAIVDAVARRDVELAGRLSVEHVRAAGERLIEHFSGQGHWLAPSPVE